MSAWGKGSFRLAWVAAANLSVIFPALSQSLDLAAIYSEARRAQEAGDIKTAIDKYRQIVRVRPDLAEAHSNLGALYHEKNQIEEAVSSFQTAMKLKPDLVAPHFFLGMIAFKSRQYDSAFLRLRKAEELDPSNVPVQLYLGYTCYAQSKFLPAARHFEKAAKLDPLNQDDAFYHLGKAYGQLAKRFFGDLQREFPDSFYTNLAKAHFYESDANWEKAALNYEKALAMQPGNERLRQKLQASVRRKPGEPAVSTLNGVPDDVVDGSTGFLYNPPSGEKIQSDLADYRGRVSRLQRESANTAAKFFFLAEYYQDLSYLASLVVAQHPDSYRAHQLQGQYYETLGKDSEAIQQYRRALELKPDLENVHFSIGNLYWKNGQLENALPELHKELEINPQHPNALYEMADVLYASGRLDEAERYYLRSLRLDPAMLEAYLGVERIYSSQGKYEKSLEFLRRAAKVAPADPTAHYRIASIYRKLGNLQEAQMAMKEFERLKTVKDQP